MDGYLNINTRLKFKGLKQDLSDAKKELNKFKKQEEKLNNKKLEIEAQVNIDKKDYDAKLAQIKKEWNNELQDSASKSFGGKASDFEKEIIQSKYQPRIQDLEENSSYSKSKEELAQIEEQLKTNKELQEEWNIKVDELNSKVSQIEFKKEINQSLKNMNKSITSIIKSVGKWVLAIFSIRTIYAAISKAVSTLSQYNSQLAADISYIEFAVASILEPVIEKVVSLIYKMLAYVKYLAKAWFDIDLFANASADRFNKANSSAKKLSKTLAGFDEINQLSDNSSSSSSTSTPSVDLSSINDVEIPDWLVKIKEFFQPVIDFFDKVIEKYGPVVTAIGLVVGALAGFLILKSITSLLTGFGRVGFSADFTGFFDGLGKATEAIAILGGLTLVIESITDLIDTFSESGLSLKDTAILLAEALGIIAVAFTVFMGVMTLMEPSWTSIAAAAVIFAGLALVLNSVTGLLDAFSESGLSLTDVITLMSTILITIVALMGSIVLLGPAMTAGLGPFLVVIASISALLIVMAATIPTILDAVGDFIEQIGPTVISLLNTIGDIITNIIYALGTTLPPIIRSVGSVFTSVFKTIGESIEKIIYAFGTTLPKVINSVGGLFNTIFSGIKGVIDSVGNNIVKVLNSIGNLVDKVLTSLLNFIKNLGPAIETFVDSAISSVTKLINFMISGIEYMVNTLVVDGVNKIINGINSIGKYVGFTIPTLNKFQIARFQPTYMATGGIIDVPKTGVPLANNVIGGEAGAEGVLPLTDESTMQRLGQEIGKWITLNVDLTGKMNERVLFRELVKYQNEQSFARNGGN